MYRFVSISLCALILSTAGCGDDAVSFSAPVGIGLKTKSADVSGGSVKAKKGITTESGNPWGAFISDARAKLDGSDPGRIEASQLALYLQTTSTNVTALNEVFNGQVDVVFIMNDSNNEFPVAHATIDAETEGRGPVMLDIDFDSTTILSDDWSRLMAGSFEVSLAGPAGPSFDTKGAEAALQLTFTFAAFE
jgi:hypothetical protein